MNRATIELRQTFTCPGSPLYIYTTAFNYKPVVHIRFAHKSTQKSKPQQQQQQVQLHDLTASALPSSAYTLNTQLKAFNTATDDAYNAPESTLPAAIEDPGPRKPGQSLPSWLFSKGKAFAKFYKTGVLNAAWYNTKLAAPVVQRFKQDGGMESAKKMSWLTRSDLLLIQRRNHDLRRIPVFALIFAICGEFTPFVVIAISSLVPYTCRIPKQINKDRQKLEARRIEAFKALSIESAQQRTGQTLETMSPQEIVHCSDILGLHSTIWNNFFPPPVSILKPRLSRHETYINVDDHLLHRGGAIPRLNDRELELACQDRGLQTLEKSTEEMQKSLEQWMKQRYGKGARTCFDIWLTEKY